VRWNEAGWKLRGFRHTPAYSRCDTILDSAGAGEMALGTFRSVSSEPKHDASVAIDDGK
jgi:hypothetical protein